MLPLYKIITKEETLIGYYYSYQTLVLDTEKHQDIIESECHTASACRMALMSQSYRTYIYNIAVDSETFVQKQLPERYILNSCTFYRDKNNRLVFNHDIVRLSIGGVGGIVYLSKYLEYRIYIIPSTLTRNWDKTISLQDYQFEVVGNLDEEHFRDIFFSAYVFISKDPAQSAIKYIVPQRDNPTIVDYLFSEAPKIEVNDAVSLIEYHYCPRWSLFETDIQDIDSDHYGYYMEEYKYKNVCKIEIPQEENGQGMVIIGGFPYRKSKEGPITVSRIQRIKEQAEDLDHSLAHKAFERGILPNSIDALTPSAIHRPVIINEELIDFWRYYQTHIDRSKALKKFYLAEFGQISDFCFDFVNEDPNIEKPHYMESASSTVFEDDLVINIENPNLFGYVRYLSERASYMVEVPEKLISRDILFDGYLPLIDDRYSEELKEEAPKILWRLPDSNDSSEYTAPKFKEIWTSVKHFSNFKSSRTRKIEKKK